jgi:hypothetical protein
MYKKREGGRDRIKVEKFRCEREARWIKLRHIKSNQITSYQIKLRHIKSHQITSLHIRSNCVTSNHIKSRHFISDQTASHQITSHHIRSNCVTSNHITSLHIRSNQSIPCRLIEDFTVPSIGECRCLGATDEHVVISQHECISELDAGRGRRRGRNLRGR